MKTASPPVGQRGKPAILAGLAQTSLAHSVAHSIAQTPRAGLTVVTVTAEQIAEAVQRLTTGDLAQAAASLPQISRHDLAQSYTQAFTRLVHLIVITLLSACASFAFLSRRTASSGDQPGEPQRKVAETAAV
ncbi:hypothetical protein [Paraburkholderia strydomiana]|jgi:hypothetical protein|uniref:hypothetical protein n=1 Tax=Paraburkholderia strydomiana TaxID=1245417 RepID=UPI0038B71B46